MPACHPCSVSRPIGADNCYHFLLPMFAHRSIHNLLTAHRIWRKRVGVEPTIRPAKDRIAGFEGRESHRTLFASTSSIEERFAVSQGKVSCDGKPLRRLVGCGSTLQRGRRVQGSCKPRNKHERKEPQFSHRGAIAGPYLCATLEVPRILQGAPLR